jgi:Predicted signal-transduction protein containing cAMP-binding and CBS domains
MGNRYIVVRAVDLARKTALLPYNGKLRDAAAAVLRDGACAVVDGDYVMGLLTERDIVGAAARGVPADAPVVEAVDRPPLLVEGVEPLWRVAEAMVAARAEVAAVTVGGRFVGVISAEDIAGAEGQLAEAAEFSGLMSSFAPPA